uniref:Uncharacterized protein n=1 Tax=Ovis aries TaxID=9940 RepID=A0AC11CV37_SHEEP
TTKLPSQELPCWTIHHLVLNEDSPVSRARKRTPHLPEPPVSLCTHHQLRSPAMIVVLWMLLIAGTMWKGYKYPPGGTPVEISKDDPGEVMQL